MNEALERALALAATKHGAVGLDQLRRLGIDTDRLHNLVGSGRLLKAGPRSFVAPGSPRTWQQRLHCTAFDLAGKGYLAGRTVARLNGLDGFSGDDVEVLVERAHRGIRTPAQVRSTARPIQRADWRMRDSLPQLTVERMILEAGCFRFTTEELENAIDSAVRLRLVSESRLRDRAQELAGSGRYGSRRLVVALHDSGGESALERQFLRLLRRHGLPTPRLQVTHRVNGRVVGRVDAQFPNGLIVELAGHATHSTRRQRQHDAQRQTELTLRGARLLTFTWEDVNHRPGWVAEQIARGIG